MIFVGLLPEGLADATGDAYGLQTRAVRFLGASPFLCSASWHLLGQLDAASSAANNKHETRLSHLSCELEQ